MTWEVSLLRLFISVVLNSGLVQCLEFELDY